MPGLSVELVPAGQLDDLAQVHDRDPVADVPDHGQVVRDHHVGQVQLVLQVLEQVDDLGLDRHVERGHRLVGDDQLGPQRQGAGDPDALPLATGELVRVAVVVLGAEAHQLEQLLHGALDPARRLDVLQPERRAHDRAHGVPRVERGVGILEDHLDLAPQRAHLARPQVRDVMSLDHDLTAGRLVQPGQQAPGRGLAASRFADQAEGLSPGHRQVDPVHGADRADLVPEHDAAGDGEMPDQPGDLEQRVTVALRAGPCRRGRRRRDRFGHASTRPCDTGPWAAWPGDSGSWAGSDTMPAGSAFHCRVLSSTVRWQAAACPGVTVSRSGGTSVSQRPPVRWV
jgi:hypothetical protein